MDYWTFGQDDKCIPRCLRFLRLTSKRVFRVVRRGENRSIPFPWFRRYRRFSVNALLCSSCDDDGWLNPGSDWLILPGLRRNYIITVNKKETEILQNIVEDWCFRRIMRYSAIALYVLSQIETKSSIISGRIPNGRSFCVTRKAWLFRSVSKIWFRLTHYPRQDYIMDCFNSRINFRILPRSFHIFIYV